MDIMDIMREAVEAPSPKPVVKCQPTVASSQPLCAKCGTPGAGSDYRGQLYHMACKLEVKAAAGEWASTSAPDQPRLRGTGTKRKRQGAGKPRT
jgi:hypothetical protein